MFSLLKILLFGSNILTAAWGMQQMCQQSQFVWRPVRNGEVTWGDPD
jgi:hypothetical protein